MQKNISVNIAVDGVELKDLEPIQEAIEDVFKDYPDKRITVIMQDLPLVKFS
jgi:2-phospho-L-lactate guanylyltransferase (CobY/MobA/RfbA family)